MTGLPGEDLFWGRARRALVFDSGLGGLTVLSEIRRLRPDVEIVYVADDAAFPYGRLGGAELIARVETVMARVIADHQPDIVVVACSTASTLRCRACGRPIPRPCFVERDGRRTDHVVLACTHFPLLIGPLERAAPWPVAFVDPAPAIARRLDSLLGAATSGSESLRGAAIFTSGAEPPPSLQKALLRYGLTFTPTAAISLAPA